MPPEKHQAVLIDPPVRVLVAVPTPLQGSLVHFFLEEAGFRVLPEALPADVVTAATDARPDAVVLHEMLASRDGGGFVQRIRRASPSARIVVLAKQPNEAWCGPARGADAYLDEWIGIADLEDVLRSTRRGAAVQTASAAGAQPVSQQLRDDAPADLQTRWARAPGTTSSRRAPWWHRLQGAAVAVVLLLALLLSIGGPHATISDAGRRGAADRLNRAYTLLVYDLSTDTPRGTLVAEAQELLSAHDAAMHAGVDVGSIDAIIRSRMPALLSNVPSGTASRIRAIIGPIWRTPAPSPGPSASPAPPPSPTPPPTASPTPTEIPTSVTETPPPSSTEPPTSTPTEAPTTETGSPAPAVGDPGGSPVDQT